MALIFFCDDFSKSICSNFSYVSVINVSENVDSAFLKDTIDRINESKGEE
ncbi:hypothetical protein G8J22_00545 [Lentilactobacillus hilgardii]|nr:hypothetical protein G8J22_00545 [Lentilactobacillus hilgardii]